MNTGKAMSRALEVEHLYKSYGRKAVLDGCSFTLEHGLHGFLGPNGAGKTTLFQIISGYVTGFSGEIRYPQVNQNRRVLRGILPQRFQGYGQMSIEEFMLYMADIKLPSAGKRYAREDMNEKLDIFGLQEKRKDKIKTLSGGQLRRLGIAQAFQFNPEIVLLDEPTAGLDPSERIHFKNYISEASAYETILLSTHIVTDLENIASDLYLLKDGRIVCHGEERQLIDQLEGCVWIVDARTENEICQLTEGWGISSIYEHEGRIRARIVTDGSSPCADAFSVTADLADVYLSVFGKT